MQEDQEMPIKIRMRVHAKLSDFGSLVSSLVSTHKVTSLYKSPTNW